MMPGGKKPGPSIRKPKMYEGLKKAGYSKEDAAAISNAQALREEGSKKRKEEKKGGER